MHKNERLDGFLFITLAHLAFSDKLKDIILHVFLEKRETGTGIGILEARVTRYR
jgi:hypothetical protein